MFSTIIAYVVQITTKFFDVGFEGQFKYIYLTCHTTSFMFIFLKILFRIQIAQLLS